MPRIDRLSRHRITVALLLAPLAACSRQAADNSSDRARLPLANLPLRPAIDTSIPAESQPPPSGPDGFVPLRSDKVKDAIHQALRTGRTQRWQDGALSGYAVPSLTTDAHGCRAVRYTIDQTPNAPPASITACDAG